MISTITIFVLGALAVMFLIAGVFFLRFWRESRDSFFLAFAVSFLIRGLNSAQPVFMDRPSVGSPLYYLVDVCSSLLILVAILKKNLGEKYLVIEEHCATELAEC